MLTDAALELGDRVGERGFEDVQGRGRGGQSAVVGQDGEQFQLPQGEIHRDLENIEDIVRLSALHWRKCADSLSMWSPVGPRSIR